jgi:hypothetical protein
MEKRNMKIDKGLDDNYIVNLNMTVLNQLLRSLGYTSKDPSTDILKFIGRYANLKEQPGQPILAEALNLDMTNILAVIEFAQAIKLLASNEDMGLEIYEGIIKSTIPAERVKVNFEILLVEDGPTIAGTTVRDPDDISINDDDDFKSIEAVNQELRFKMPGRRASRVGRQEPVPVIGFQPSARVEGTGPINIGLKEKKNTVIKEVFIPKAYEEQPFAKEINHETIPDIDSYSRASKLDKIDISKKRLENLSSTPLVLAFVRELEAYIKSGVTKGIVVSTVADAKQRTMEFIAERFNLSDEETQNLTFDELRMLYAWKITRNMDEVAPIQAREEVAKALKENGKYSTFGLAHMKTNNADKAASFIADIDQVMSSLFGDGKIDVFTMKIFTDGIKVHDKEGNEKKIRIIGSDKELDNIRANIKLYASTWPEIKNILKATAVEMDADVQTRIDKGMLQEQKDQISRMIKSEERQALEREKERDKRAKDGDRKRVNQNQSGKQDDKRPLACDICGGPHYAFDKGLTAITCEKHKDTDLSKQGNEKLKKDIEDKMAKRKRDREARERKGRPDR